ncbi:MAG: ATP-binding protein [Candidatus Atribacteria bacterium]|nr:ATP-binding protein [Candidatus Atribacteria bacterium]
MTKKLLQLYGLKWNPFAPDVPTEALLVTPRVKSFTWRVEQLARDGGFAAIIGEPGTGKSITLRLLVARLATLRDIVVGVLTRPQAGLADFYREIGHLFGVPLSPHNRWAGAKALRDTWLAHIETVLVRPVLLVDEAQDVRTDVLNELRLLASADLDSRVILTVVLAGDRRLQERLREIDLLPLDSRLRVKLLLDAAARDDLVQCLRHALDTAGNPRLLTPGLLDALVDHAGGNYRTLMAHAHELLLAGAEREVPQLDETLFFELCAQAPADRPRARAARTR